jgi:hypothetical protein
MDAIRFAGWRRRRMTSTTCWAPFWWRTLRFGPTWKTDPTLPISLDTIDQGDSASSRAYPAAAPAGAPGAAAQRASGL